MKITLTEDMIKTLSMSRKQFIELNKEYLKSLNQDFYMDNSKTNKKGEIVPENIDPLQCPLHIWHIYNKTNCPSEFVSLTAVCPLCDQPMCPTCGNHKVHQLSRVTGYMSDVDQWNAAKREEFKQRTRYNVG